MSSSQCPICFEDFPPSAIERHASNCKGKKEVKAPDSTPVRTSPWSGFKRKRSDLGNGGGENETSKSTKFDQKEEKQEADASASVIRKDWFLAFC